MGAHKKHLDLLAAIPQLLLSLAFMWMIHPDLPFRLVDGSRGKGIGGLNVVIYCLLPDLDPGESTYLRPDQLDGRRCDPLPGTFHLAATPHPCHLQRLSSEAAGKWFIWLL